MPNHFFDVAKSRTLFPRVLGSEFKPDNFIFVEAYFNFDAVLFGFVAFACISILAPKDDKEINSKSIEPNN